MTRHRAGTASTAETPATAAENPVDPAQFATEEFRIKAPIRPTISKVSCPHCPGAAFFDGTSGWMCMKCGPVYGAALQADGVSREPSSDDTRQ
ncbi:hypothetical protein [Streptantibioticus ferralitis]|uniref:Uncharacterized protein n=1 Tax=Streptantibioticus ferralitis TaxID=236510 RepID=A0ABT5YTR7_9ACTN|nr:hypothetical protein [Streptantibioticus ferralitis]MDF2254995.1 hypothetical protein [Streptantibioticus ferralitis]